MEVTFYLLITNKRVFTSLSSSKSEKLLQMPQKPDKVKPNVVCNYKSQKG